MSTATLTVPEIAFEPFGKIGRLNRPTIVTEKIDGTNASVYVDERGAVYAASRKRWITPEDDNFGFARWVAEHADDLRCLGTGHHFGEWWGRGIQRGYGIEERRFSLFNALRWEDPDQRPECCGVVPILVRSESFDSDLVALALEDLREHGSVAAPGFMQPEGVVVFHPQSRQAFKVTLEGDDHGKGHGA